MSELTPTSGDRTVVIHRHGVLTWISLGFNALILLLILVGIARHPHDGRRPGGERAFDSDRGQECAGGCAGPGAFDRHEGRPFRRAWDHRSWGGPREEENRFRPNDDHGPEMDEGEPMGGPGRESRPDFGPKDHPLPGMNPPTTEAMTDRFMLMMTERLSLTDAESAQVRPIVQQQIAQFQKDMETQKQGHRKMIDDAKAKIRPLLNADQQKQFDGLTAGFGASAASPGAPPPPPK